MSSSSSARFAASGIAVAFVLAVVGVFIWLFGAQLGHFAWTAIRTAWPVVAVLIVACIIGVVLLSRDSFGGLFVFVFAAVAGSVLLGMFGAYSASHRVAQSVEVQEAADLDFQQRVPYDVANAVSSRNLGETTGDATGGVKALPAQGENGLYTTSVVRRGLFQGYESTQTMDLNLYGSASSQNVTFCEFDENAKLRFGGSAPQNNLTRAIQWRTTPSTKVHQEDAFVFCEDGTPMVYAPLTKLSGDLFFPHRVPGGVAVYNGETGALSIHGSLEADGLPIYPKSIAQDQRESLKASGSFIDWIFNRAGWEDTSVDEDDPNGENRSEFGLVTTDGSRELYVTPLTARGSSSSIVALGTVDSSGEVTSGQLREYTVNRYTGDEVKQANSSVAARITGEVLSGYMASGLEVFEVVPSEEGTWTATVGKEQTVLYRAVIHPDGQIELLDADGNNIAGDSSDGEGADTPTLDAGKPIEEMTSKELQQLGTEILEELARRGE